MSNKVEMKTNLSISSINDLIKLLELKESSYSKVVENVASKLADEMEKEVLDSKYTGMNGKNPYSGTKKEVETDRNKAVAKISIQSNSAYFNEFGTGVVGASNPSINTDFLPSGYSYGTEGWWYPTDEDDMNTTKRVTETGDIIAFTSGIPALDGYYKALNNANDKFMKIAMEEINKIVKEAK